MDKYLERNRQAWDYHAYDYWVNHLGTPEEMAKKDLADPRAMLKRYSDYFKDLKDVKIAVICGSGGRKAVPLTILGATVTVFDLSKENARYATETAEAAGVRMDYIVGNVLDIHMSVYGGAFDIVFMEGGILHYFHDIDRFMGVMYALLKKGGRMICNDVHPINKVMDVLESGIKTDNYFSVDILEAEVPHAKYYDEEIRAQFPKCVIRRYTISEIINSAIKSGFIIKGFDEHPAWTNEKLPGEFTLLADKC